MASGRSRGNPIEWLIEAERWTEARRAILARLRDEPDHHWVLSRLALTYYEQHAYRRALEIERRAERIAPNCPLVLWGLAGSHQMLGQHRDAVALYQRLIRRGAVRIGNGRCGEGMRWARGLVADCWFRLGLSHVARRDSRRAKFAFRKALALRSRTASIYSAAEIRGRLRALDVRRERRSRR